MLSKSERVKAQWADPKSAIRAARAARAKRERKRLTPELREIRFWSKVDAISADACWEWLAGRDKDGYGQFTFGPHSSASPRAHRVAYELTFGAPGKACVLHTCDNPPCCNPAHLWLGTQLDNTRDAFNKGRRSQNAVGRINKGFSGQRHSRESLRRMSRVQKLAWKIRKEQRDGGQ